MTNLTLSIDDDLLKKARIRAIQRGTSVNAEIRRFLEQYTGTEGARQDSVQRVLEWSRSAQSRSAGRRWNRDELYQR